MEPSRGDIYFADLNPVLGSEQGGFRPVLIIQNDIGNKYSPTVIVSAITSQIQKAKLPTHVELPVRHFKFRERLSYFARTDKDHRQEETEKVGCETR